MKEPLIESRFGFQTWKSRVLSPFATKLLMSGSVIAIVFALWRKGPDEPERSGSHPSVNAPEISDASGNGQNMIDLEKYSANSENLAIASAQRKSGSRTKSNLPGGQQFVRDGLFEIPTGTELRAKLLTGAAIGIVKAVALESIKVRGAKLVSAGDILTGVAQTTEARLYIHFALLARKDGSKQTLEAEAADAETKTAGLTGPAFSRFAAKYATAVGLNFVSGMSEVLQNRTAVGQQVVAEPSARNALLNGAGKAALEIANDSVGSLRSRSPVISIEAGREILIIFTGTESK